MGMLELSFELMALTSLIKYNSNKGTNEFKHRDAAKFIFDRQKIRVTDEYREISSCAMMIAKTELDAEIIKKEKLESRIDRHIDSMLAMSMDNKEL